MQTSLKRQNKLAFFKCTSPRKHHFELLLLTVPNSYTLLFFHLLYGEILAGIQLHVWDARLLCSPGMNPSEQSLEYSLLNLDEGHTVQLFPTSLPSEQTYGHGAPWTCLGDQSYLAWVATAKRKSGTRGGLGLTC